MDQVDDFPGFLLAPADFKCCFLADPGEACFPLLASFPLPWFRKVAPTVLSSPSPLVPKKQENSPGLHRVASKGEGLT